MSNLIELLPEFYQNSREMVAIQNAIQPEVDRIKARRDDMLQQLSPYTATWGLGLWEVSYGLKSAPDKDIEFRRTRVVSHLRGNGPTTVAMVKNVAESFTNGTVELEEYFNQYRLEIRFPSAIGMPPNLEDLTAALNAILPAHIVWEYVCYYHTHNALAALTHEQMAAYTHATLREGSLD